MKFAILFVMTAPLLIFQYSNAGSNETVGQVQPNTLSSSLQNQTIQAGTSIEMDNLSKSALVYNQTKNKTNYSTAYLGIEHSLLNGTHGNINTNGTYKITVKFDSIKVHNDHEGLFNGDGEYDLVAYVQGTKIGLTDASGPGSGLWDVSPGETVIFAPSTQVTLYLPLTTPLSIFTVGAEIDDCGRIEFPDQDNPHLITLLNLFKNPQLNWYDPVVNFQNYVKGFSECPIPHSYYTDVNEILGTITEFYDPPEWGAGTHTNVVSSNGDYSLRYSITVEPPAGGGGVITEPLLPCRFDLPITAVTSSASQAGSGPTNAIDNNLNTKWVSTLSVNPFITFDLGSPKSVCRVDIAWADGNSRPYSFRISISNDGTTFSNILSPVSSGTTTSPEKYMFQEIQSRYVKITVTQSISGSINSIAQISEVRLFSSSPYYANKGPISPS